MSQKPDARHPPPTQDDLEDEDYDQRKKHKTSKARAFIDEEADVDEDEDEDEVDEADGDLIDDAGEVHEEPTDAFRYREVLCASLVVQL